MIQAELAEIEANTKMYVRLVFVPVCDASCCAVLASAFRAACEALDIDNARPAWRAPASETRLPLHLTTFVKARMAFTLSFYLTNANEGESCKICALMNSLKKTAVHHERAIYAWQRLRDMR